MKILFMCIANSTRSLFAEALAQRMIPGAKVASAGTSRLETLHVGARRALEEMGIPTSALHAKSVDDLPPGFVEGLDYLVTLGPEKVSPALSGGTVHLHWLIEDPADFEQKESESETLIRYRNARDRIAGELLSFGASLEQKGSRHTIPAW